MIFCLQLRHFPLDSRSEFCPFSFGVSWILFTICLFFNFLCISFKWNFHVVFEILGVFLSFSPISFFFLIPFFPYQFFTAPVYARDTWQSHRNECPPHTHPCNPPGYFVWIRFVFYVIRTNFLILLWYLSALYILWIRPNAYYENGGSIFWISKICGFF